MRVVMLTSTAGRPARRYGEIVTVDPKVGRKWIQDGIAGPVRDEPIETATAEPPPENTARKRRRR